MFPSFLLFSRSTQIELFPRVHDLFFFVCRVPSVRSFVLHFSAILVWCLEGLEKR